MNYQLYWKDKNKEKKPETAHFFKKNSMDLLERSYAQKLAKLDNSTHYNEEGCWWALFLKMGQPRPLFHLFLSFQTHITIFTTIKCENFSIKCTVPGFELMTFRTWVSSPNHYTRAPALWAALFLYHSLLLFHTSTIPYSWKGLKW